MRTPFGLLNMLELIRLISCFEKEDIKGLVINSTSPSCFLILYGVGGLGKRTKCSFILTFWDGCMGYS